mgnify:CR=1 FL=1
MRAGVVSLGMLKWTTVGCFAVAGLCGAYLVMVGGAPRDVTLLMQSVPGLMAKDGADSVYAAALPDEVANPLQLVRAELVRRQIAEGVDAEFHTLKVAGRRCQWDAVCQG